MNRYEKIKELYSKIEIAHAQMALLMGQTSDYIDESYYEEKEKYGAGLIKHLDQANLGRFRRLNRALQREYQDYIWRREGNE
ncbi:MAG: hypothetical protein ACTSU2_17535 [Promethearchaeota archaeon]